MVNLSFSLPDYQSALAAGGYSPPDRLCPYYDVDPIKYRRHADTDLRRGRLDEAVRQIRLRTGQEYSERVYPLQARTLDYSARAFPAYRFILPEVISEDWLAIVDWGKFQRDHVLHQPLCGYVVLKLLSDDTSSALFLTDTETLFLDLCVDRILAWEGTAYIRDFLLDCGMQEDDPILDPDSPIAHHVWRIFFREAAYVAAVFHDLGYPWQYAERMQCNLDGMNTPAVRQNRNAEDIINQFGHRLLFHALHGYQTPDAACPSTWHDKIRELTDVALSQTHGFPGALGFLHLNDCVRRYPSDTQSPLHLLCVEWTAMAIMMHDMSKVYWGKGIDGSGIPENPSLRLSFDTDPLSAIVTLADVIQDFDRPVAKFRHSSASSSHDVTIKYDTACLSVDMDVSGSEWTLRYKMDSSDSLAVKRECLVREYREYFDRQYGYLDMQSLGANVQMDAEI